MKKIDASNYKDFPPDVLAKGVHDGTMGIVELAIEGVIEIAKYIASGIASKKMLKNQVKGILAFNEEQVKINDLFLNYIKEHP